MKSSHSGCTKTDVMEKTKKWRGAYDESGDDEA